MATGEELVVKDGKLTQVVKSLTERLNEAYNKLTKTAKISTKYETFGKEDLTTKKELVTKQRDIFEAIQKVTETMEKTGRYDYSDALNKLNDQLKKLSDLLINYGKSDVTIKASLDIIDAIKQGDTATVNERIELLRLEAGKLPEPLQLEAGEQIKQLGTTAKTMSEFMEHWMYKKTPTKISGDANEIFKGEFTNDIARDELIRQEVDRILERRYEKLLDRLPDTIKKLKPNEITDYLRDRYDKEYFETAYDGEYKDLDDYLDRNRIEADIRAKSRELDEIQTNIENDEIDKEITDNFKDKVTDPKLKDDLEKRSDTLKRQIEEKKEKLEIATKTEIRMPFQETRELEGAVKPEEALIPKEETALTSKEETAWEEKTKEEKLSEQKASELIERAKKGLEEEQKAQKEARTLRERGGSVFPRSSPRVGVTTRDGTTTRTNVEELGRMTQWQFERLYGDEVQLTEVYSSPLRINKEGTLTYTQPIIKTSTWLTPEQAIEEANRIREDATIKLALQPLTQAMTQAQQMEQQATQTAIQTRTATETQTQTQTVTQPQVAMEMQTQTKTQEEIITDKYKYREQPPPPKTETTKPIVPVKVAYGSWVYRQGMIWRVKPPDGKIYNLKRGEIPEGVYKFATGKGSARKTLQLLPKGAIPVNTEDDLDMGWAKIHVSYRDGQTYMSVTGGKKAAEWRWQEEEAEKEQIKKEIIYSRMREREIEGDNVTPSTKRDTDIENTQPDLSTDGLEKTLLPEYSTDKIKVYAINDDWIRNTYPDTSIGDRLGVDFAGAGHHYVYWRIIPENEIWVSKYFQDDDMMGWVGHEAEERKEMKQDNLDYETAHDKANVLEEEIRENPQEADELLSEAMDENNDTESADAEIPDESEPELPLVSKDMIKLQKTAMPQFNEGKVKVYLVNGDWMRKNIDPTFRKSASWYDNPKLVPKNRIYVEMLGYGEKMEDIVAEKMRKIKAYNPIDRVLFESPNELNENLTQESDNVKQEIKRLVGRTTNRNKKKQEFIDAGGLYYLHHRIPETSFQGTI